MCVQAVELVINGVCGCVCVCARVCVCVCVCVTVLLNVWVSLFRLLRKGLSVFLHPKIYGLTDNEATMLRKHVKLRNQHDLSKWGHTSVGQKDRLVGSGSSNKLLSAHSLVITQLWAVAVW